MLIHALLLMSAIALLGLIAAQIRMWLESARGERWAFAELRIMELSRTADVMAALRRADEVLAPAGGAHANG
jgi:hypothetical protein